ncbi:VTT domain-containing protein [Parasutterella secunda]|uniref:VTT domain-containing protein n=1 Tax=Parasutterella secunda TaxID=626947 RepID=A0ABS2GTV2_9BURK|nr:VTT domain-containing protein [Parasutterella secunda]MBM6929275.1 VTT domain-containing protein [Parasutterella secunda]
MDWSLFLDLFTNVDRFLITIASDYGLLIYFVMFMIFFLETGIVVMAFLPGDSLLFVAGAVTATGAIDPWWLTAVVTLGAILGNTSNFYIGSWLGHKIYDGSISWIDQEALNKTHQFYLMHGGKTVFLARFVPIVRTFAPLIAGAASMPVLRFEFYSITGAFVWVYGLVWAGHLFGNMPFIRDHLTTILLLGIGCALIPTMAIALSKYLKKKKAAKEGAQ